MKQSKFDYNSNLKSSDTTHRWLVSYADIVTLLLALFIVLYGISAPNEGQYQEVSSSINKAFTRKKEDLSQMSEDMPGDISNVMEDSILEGYQDLLKEWKNDQDRTRNFSNMAFDLKSSIVEVVKDFQVQVNVNEDWIEISLSSDVLFSPGSSYVNYKAKDAIASISNIFLDNTFNIHIEGHTDNRPISNILYPTNWELSSARATAVLRVLEDIGIEPRRLVASGFGSEYPIASNDSVDGRRKNRRVIFIIPKNDRRINFLKEKSQPFVTADVD